MAVINIDDAYILGETGAQVDKVTGLFTKDEDTTSGEKAFAQLNIGTAGSNRNLLDNPFFQVNQRSFTTSTGNTYTVDRWIKSGNAAVTLSNGIIVFDASSATSSYNFFSQRLAQDFTGRTVTLSLMTDDGTIYSKSGEIPARTSSAQTAISLTISTGVFFEFTVSASSAAYTASIDVVLRNGRGPLNIKAVKLELGSVSTLANDVPPNYAEELEKCKYYCRVADFDTDVSVGIGWAFSNSGAVIPNIFGFGNEMRAVPTVTSTGSFVLRTTGGSNINVTSFAIGASVQDAISLNASVASGLTANQPVRLQAGTGAKLVFSADL